MLRSQRLGSTSASNSRSNGLRLRAASAATVIGRRSWGGSGGGARQHLGDGGIDFIDRDGLHADIVGAGGLAMIMRGDARRAGEPGIDGARRAERLVELRRLRAE